MADPRITDGIASFEGGVDSGKNPTAASEFSPVGLKRNQLAWAVNATMRGGGLRTRAGYRKVELTFATEEQQTDFQAGRFQSAFMYEPRVGFPYIWLSISGRQYRVRVDDDNSVEDVSAVAGEVNPDSEVQAWIEQAEEFLIIQDGISVPLIWDGATMRRANNVPVPEVPTGTCMDYYMGRLWVAQGRKYVAGDIVGGSNGTAPYENRDSVLKFQENTYLAGGGYFIVPTQAGPITALSHTANMDTALGEGELMVFTRRNVYATRVPVTRLQWQATEDPLQRVAQRNYGATSHYGVVAVNGDLFYRAPDGIRSMWLATRDFTQWGNIPISRNINRIVQAEDRGLMGTASGIEFDNRLLMTGLPQQSAQGTVFNGIFALDFDLISALGEREPPAWEGILYGLKTFQLVKGDFGGRHRAFAIVLGTDNKIEVWELSTAERMDNVAGSIEWAFETPAFVFSNPFQLKKLQSLEMFVSKIFGTVEFEVWYRPDQHPCWQKWHIWQDCAVRNPCEDPATTDCYVMQSYREQYRRYVLPEPPGGCDGQGNGRYEIGYQFQIMVVVRGWCEVRGLLVHAQKRDLPCQPNVCPPAT